MQFTSSQSVINFNLLTYLDQTKETYHPLFRLNRRQLGSTVRDGHLDAFNFIESAGAWSPDSKEFAFVAFKKGENVLIIKNVESGKTVEEAELPDVQAFVNPTWSPDGKEIVVSALVDGQIDLYSYNLRSGTVKQLTDNIYSEMQPQFSPDGSKIAFATDEWSFKNGRTHGKWTANIAQMDVATGAVEIFEVFNKAHNLNPVYDNYGNILFLSNQDGYRNMYKYNLASGQVFQMTDLKTGVSGITEYAPAIHAAPKKDRIVYTHFMAGKYTIYSAKEEQFLNKEVTTDSINFAASLLPPNNPEMLSIVDRNMSNFDNLEKPSTSLFSSADYKPKFKLDYVGGGGGVGVGANTGGFGPNTNMQGSIDLLFSDILGNNQLYSRVALNGEILDFGGQLAYVNRKKRVAWGASLSHIPYRYGGIRSDGLDTLETQAGQAVPAIKFTEFTTRRFQDRANLFAMFPVSKIQRFEASASYLISSSRVDTREIFTDNIGTPFFATNREKLEDAAPPTQRFAQLNAAWVGDNSYFGMASPTRGYRYRVGVDQYFGDFQFTHLTADARVYWYAKPFTIGFRATHFGVYGQTRTISGDLESERSPIIYNIAYPWLVRGYNYGQGEIVDNNSINVNQLVGKKMFISNLELRLPFTGPKGLAILGSKFLFTELNLFFDGGMAWNNFDEFKDFNSGNLESGPEPIFSAGISARINLFGAMILEPFMAWPLQENSSLQFGLNFAPGW